MLTRSRGFSLADLDFNVLPLRSSGTVASRDVVCCLNPASIGRPGSDASLDIGDQAISTIRIRTVPYEYGITAALSIMMIDD